jgi:hypothetical protein
LRHTTASLVPQAAQESAISPWTLWSSTLLNLFSFIETSRVSN